MWVDAKVFKEERTERIKIFVKGCSFQNFSSQSTFPCSKSLHLRTHLLQAKKKSVSGRVALSSYLISIHFLNTWLVNWISVEILIRWRSNRLSEPNLSCPLGCLWELAQVPWSQQQHSLTSKMSLPPKLRVPSNISQPKKSRQSTLSFSDDQI